MKTLLVFVVVLVVFVFGEAAASDQTQQQVRVSVQLANVRDIPSLQGGVIFQVSQGEMLWVIKKEGSWCFVENSTGRKGYISNSLVRVVESRIEPRAPGSLPAVHKKPSDGVFRNSDVVAMAKAGLSDSIIIAAIKQSNSAEFDLSPAGLIALKNGGVSEAVIQVIIDRSGPQRDVVVLKESVVSESPKKSELPPARPQQVPPSPTQVRNPSIPNQSGPGRFGAGLNLSAAPGGAVPSILYDLNDRLTVNGAFGFYTGATGVMGELLYRFPRPPKNPPADVVFEPYVGGGLVFVSVRYRFGLASESYTGFVGSGGTFLTFREIPRWRFSGDLNLTQFSVEGITVSGMGIRLGFHYFF